MKIKTADLIDPALDWAVAKCLQPGYEEWRLIRWIEQEFTPTANWSQGGPLIEREKIELRCNDYEWQAFCFGFPVSRAHSGTRTWAAGPTPLIAAMRCLVASRLGDEVDIPEELL